MYYRVRYLLDFDLKIRSGQVCFLSVSLPHFAHCMFQIVKISFSAHSLFYTFHILHIRHIRQILFSAGSIFCIIHFRHSPFSSVPNKGAHPLSYFVLLMPAHLFTGIFQFLHIPFSSHSWIAIFLLCATQTQCWNACCHGLRTPNEGINQRHLKNWADVADKICFGRT